MNNKTNYALVGFFVLIGFFAIIAVAYLMLRPTDELEMKKYVIYFNESVLGLNLNSPVKYRGIDVGKVVELGINPKNTEQVRVVISVDKKTPIKETTVAKLTSQGITGLSYINLSLGDKSSPLLTKPPKGEKYPVIKTVPSFFESFQTSFGNLYNKVSKSLDNVDRLLNPQNQKELSALLQESRTFVAQLNKTLDDTTTKHLQHIIKEVDQLTVALNQATPKLNQLVEHSIGWENNISASLESIAVSYLSIQKSMDDIGSAFARGDFDIKGISSEFMPTLNATLDSLNSALVEFQQSIETYKNSPRDLLFKERQIQKAPGE